MSENWTHCVDCGFLNMQQRKTAFCDQNRNIPITHSVLVDDIDDCAQVALQWTVVDQSHTTQLHVALENGCVEVLCRHIDANGRAVCS